MKTKAINWNKVTTEEVAEIFKSTFKDVIILPNMEIFRELKKATKGGKVRDLRFVENDYDYEITTYAFESYAGQIFHAQIDAESGEACIGPK